MNHFHSLDWMALTQSWSQAEAATRRLRNNERLEFSISFRARCHRKTSTSKRFRSFRRVAVWIWALPRRTTSTIRPNCDRLTSTKLHKHSEVLHVGHRHLGRNVHKKSAPSAINWIWLQMLSAVGERVIEPIISAELARPSRGLYRKFRMDMERKSRAGSFTWERRRRWLSHSLIWRVKLLIFLWRWVAILFHFAEPGSRRLMQFFTRLQAINSLRS